jgi:radical SAM superfamily enzyme YgiQ (UPF0313 family)
MKVVFVYPDFSIGAKGKFYHGIASVSAVLKQKGHETSLIHLKRPTRSHVLTESLKKEAPELIAFSSTTNMFSHVAKHASLLKNHFEVPIICGGIHPTLDPQEALLSPGIDMVCVGEGEEALVELCENLSEGRGIQGVRNIWTREGESFLNSGMRPLIEDLDSLPFPDREIFDYGELEDARLGRVTFMASRGCPYECSYCGNHQLKRLYKGKYVRFRSVDSVVEEARLVLSKQSCKYAVFHDDIFTLNMKWLDEFRVKWKSKVALPFSCNSRVNLLNEDVIRLLKEAGCFEVSMGIESGDEDLRQEVLNRKMSDEDIVRAFELCQRHGIRTISYNMVGLPFENMARVLKTVKLNARLRPDNIQVSIFYPYPHTKLYELSKKSGFLTGKTLNSYFEETILEQPTISREQVGFAFKYFGVLVRLYGSLSQLPSALSALSCKLLDLAVSWRLTSRLLIRSEAKLGGKG